MLDVDGGIDVDTGVQQLLDVPPAFGMTAARRIRVRQLVDEDHRGPTGEGAIEVELPQHGASMLDVTPRQDLEPLQQGFGFGTAVRLDTANDHVDAGGLLLTAGLEHRVRFADAGRGAEEHLQLAEPAPRLLGLDAREKRFGIAPPMIHGRRYCTSAGAGLEWRAGANGRTKRVR